MHLLPSYGYNPANRPLEYQRYKIEDYKDYGLIEPKDDPGIPSTTATGAVSSISQLDKDAQSNLSFTENCHLPKGLFSLEEIKSHKKNLVISFTEDDQDCLRDVLKALDLYFKLDIGESKRIRDKFNIFIAWSTSDIDAMKVLKLVKDKIGDFANAFTLFLTDGSINEGTGPNFNMPTRSNSLGLLAAKTEAKKLFDIPESNYQVITQTSSAQQYDDFKTNTDTAKWRDYSPNQIQQEIDNLVADMKTVGNDLEIGKLENALRTYNEPPLLNGIRIPIEAFVRRYKGSTSNKGKDIGTKE